MVLVQQKAQSCTSVMRPIEERCFLALLGRGGGGRRLVFLPKRER